MRNSPPQEIGDYAAQPTMPRRTTSQSSLGCTISDTQRNVGISNSHCNELSRNGDHETRDSSLRGELVVAYPEESTSLSPEPNGCISEDKRDQGKETVRENVVLPLCIPAPAKPSVNKSLTEYAHVDCFPEENHSHELSIVGSQQCAHIPPKEMSPVLLSDNTEPVHNDEVHRNSRRYDAELMSERSPRHVQMNRLQTELVLDSSLERVGHAHSENIQGDNIFMTSTQLAEEIDSATSNLTTSKADDEQEIPQPLQDTTDYIGDLDAIGAPSQDFRDLYGDENVPGAFAVAGIRSSVSSVSVGSRQQSSSETFSPFSDITSVAVASRVDEVPTVTAIPIEDDNSIMKILQQKCCRRSRRQRLAMVVFGIGVVAVAAISISLLVTREWASQFQNNEKARDIMLRTMLANASSENGLNDTTSAQHRAFEWMANKANHAPDILRINDEEKVVQRYALATLYYATGGPNWIDQNGFLANGNECNWKGLPSQQWQQGVSCNSQDTVVAIVLDRNGLKGTIPSEIGLLTEMRYLRLWANALSGQIPDEVGQLTHMTNLILSENDLTGPVPTDLGRMTNLDQLRLGENHLAGMLPSQLGMMTMLTEIGLSDNDLNSTLPSEIGELKSLSELDFDESGIYGTIPSELEGCEALVHLELPRNRLTGPISFLRGLMALTFIEIESNFFSGVIPSEIGEMSALDILDLHNNKLSGTVPRSLANLSFLTELELQDNDLSGEVEFLCDALRNIEDFFVDLDEVNCSCCDNESEDSEDD